MSTEISEMFCREIFRKVIFFVVGKKKEEHNKTCSEECIGIDQVIKNKKESATLNVS